jgi:ABC-2 type transport system ATP-binding protein
VFFSSHQISEVERIAEQVCIVDKGQLVADLAMDDLRQDYRRITLGFPEVPRPEKFQIPGIRRVRTEGRQVVLIADHDADAVVELARSMEPATLDVTPLGLREVFLEAVSSEAAHV